MSYVTVSGLSLIAVLVLTPAIIRGALAWLLKE